MNERFTVGILGPPFGVKGFIKVRSLSGETKHLLDLDSITLRLADTERILTLEAAEERGGLFLMKFRGIDSPEAAKGLQGGELLLPRDKGAQLGTDEYYVEDLRGITLLGGDSAPLGVVTDVLEGGGGYLLEVKLPGNETQLVPFRKEFVGEIDLAARTAPLLAPWILD